MLDNNYGVIPPSGEYDKQWPFNFNLPQGVSGSLSTAGWTLDNVDENNFGNEGFVQQTFLGASVRGFDLTAGFGDTTSTLNIQLVNDEYNKSDRTGLGRGDDPYHSGIKDTFYPPVVGSPVYFKFGKNPSTVEQSFRQTFDDLYKMKTLPAKTVTSNAWGYPFDQEDYDPDEFPELEAFHMVDLVAKKVEDRSPLWDETTAWRGRNHFAFGGVLQSYTQNKSTAGAPLYSVTVTDPREILSSVDVLLNNYQGTTFNNKNIINLYGFLEYDPSTPLVQTFDAAKRAAGIVEKYVNPVDGFVDYYGINADWNLVDGWVTEEVDPSNPYNSISRVITDTLVWTPLNPQLVPINVTGGFVNLQDQYYFGKIDYFNQALPEYFPITGQGFSRRSDKGIPWYRVSHGLAAMFQYYGFLPQEYRDAGFGGQINFRGYNYVVDFGGIPTEKIPLLYYLDFDKLDLLSLAQELCDIISHELYVTLLPIIDHPACKFLHDYNNDMVERNTPEDMVAGIIRLEAIDKTQQPKYGAIKSYIDELEDRGIRVENQDVGYELANVVTDKFVVGAQEVEMHLFHTERDRDDLWLRENDVNKQEVLQKNQWDLRTQLQQQVLPYYGKLGRNAVSIPRGFGSYQQILLDAKEINAFGVGNYYVATELELRAASVSYESWKDFLLSYNDVYIEDISEHSAFFDALSANNDQIDDVLDQFRDDVDFDSLDSSDAKDKIDRYLEDMKNRQFAVTVPRCVFASDRPYMDPNGFPASPCSPPFGYPLYYKRATRIGIVEAGVANVLNSKTRIVKDTVQLKKDLENHNSPSLKLSKKSLQKRIQKLEVQKARLASSGGKSSEAYKDITHAIEEAKAIAKTFSDIRGNAVTIGDNIDDTKDLVGEVEDITGAEAGSFARLMYNIEKTAKKHEENAKKVYEFLKKIADECLGKKYLVRIPKACNINYNIQISTFDPSENYNIQTGPFGFAPRPISSDPAYSSSVQFIQLMNNYRVGRNIDGNNIFLHYLQDYNDEIDYGAAPPMLRSQNYNYGALKGNYNPFSEKWEWNYKPEPQGGFYSYNLFGTNLSALEYAEGRIPFWMLPLSMQQGLVPIDIKNLMSDSNRMQCYVKFNNSQTLDFTGVNAEDMVQQTTNEAGQWVVDVIEALPNNNIDSETSFNSIEELKKDQRLLNKQPNSVAFVKCQVEEGLLLPPKLEEKSRTVWANEYEFTFIEPEQQFKESVDENCRVTTTPFFPRAIPNFSVPRSGGSGEEPSNWVDFKRYWDDTLKGWIIDTQVPNLDDEHAYALITVPGKIQSTVDLRWKDGPMQAYNTVKQKHLMTQDVVKIPEFSTPSLPSVGLDVTAICGKPPVFDTEEKAIAAAAEYGLASETYSRPTPKEIKEAKANSDGWAEEILNVFSLPIGFSPGSEDDWLNLSIELSLEDVSTARRITKKVLKGFALNQPQIQLGFTAPSPVFPDIVCLPLMSEERCYGPWLSASHLESGADPRVRYSNIGGRNEFIKDENLAPWNYAGYQLMDAAGRLQAQFSNSLLLFSERGGFVIPDAPTGIALATALRNEGPLVTSIGIAVDDQQGVKTTVKLDLYTSQFGKLQKQHEMAISQVARERQKIIDEKNTAIRRGLGKRQTSQDLVTSVMNGGGQHMINLATNISRQVESNQRLAKEVEETFLMVGADGATDVKRGDLERVLSTMDSSSWTSQLNKNIIAPLASAFTGFALVPDPNFPSPAADQTAAQAERFK